MIFKPTGWKLTSGLNLKVILFMGFVLALYGNSLIRNSDGLGGIVYSDAEGYHLYLPAIVVYHGFEKVPVETQIQFFAYPGTKKIFTKYTYGVALMQAPFFTATHIYELITDPAAADGCNWAYSKAVIFAACFYSVAGLFIVFYTLRRVYSGVVSLLSVIIVLAGTNLYYYTICEPGMSHVYSFFLFAIVAWFTPLVLSTTRFKPWFAYAFLCGFIILVRPTNCVVFIFPALYGCYTFAGLKQRIMCVKRHPGLVFICAIAVCISFIPQLIYWKYLSGSFFMYSYTNESFQNWYTPKILKVLFDVQNGWLLYSPVMILGLTGLFIGIYKRLPWAAPLIVMLVIATYAFGSWWSWWFGGAFGHRCYIDFYPLLAFGLATLITTAGKNRYWGMLTGLFVIACIYYSIRLTYLYVYPWEGWGWTWQKYWAVVKSIW